MNRVFFILAKVVVFILLIYTRIKFEDWRNYIEGYGIRFFVSSRGERFFNFTNILLHFCIFALGLNLLVIFLSSVYRRRQGIKRGKHDNVLAGLQNIYILVMAGAVIVTILSFFGIDTRGLFTGLSIVAAAIAVLTKDYIANILSGFAISFSDEISIGDYIKIGEHKGKVSDITLSRIALLSEDDEVIYIPNNTVFTSQIVNYTKKGIRKVNIEFELGLHFPSTLDNLEKELIKSISEYHDMIESDSYRLKVADIRKDSLSLKFQYILKQINRDLEREIRKKTVRRVVDHLRNENISEEIKEPADKK